MQRATLVGVSFGIAFLIVGAVLLGYWLDNLFDSTPWIMLTLVILVLFVKSLIEMVKE